MCRRIRVAGYLAKSKASRPFFVLMKPVPNGRSVQAAVDQDNSLAQGKREVTDDLAGGPLAGRQGLAVLIPHEFRIVAVLPDPSTNFYVQGHLFQTIRCLFHV